MLKAIGGPGAVPKKGPSGVKAVKSDLIRALMNELRLVSGNDFRVRVPCRVIQGVASLLVVVSRVPCR